MNQPFLSLIIPAYNEEKRLPDTLDQLIRFLAQQEYTAEVLVVENGSTDRTFEIANEYASRNPAIQAIHLEGRGKGLAVKHGMLNVRGAYCFMCDSDLSMPVEQINLFLPPRLDNVDIAIGSREAPGSIRYNEPAYRHIGGRFINLMIRVLVLPGLQDTQCGFKCLKSDVAKDVFQRVTLAGWSFDIEMLYIASRRGYRICEVPIDWYFQPDSKLPVVRATFRLLQDLLLIRQNAAQGVYR